MQLEDQAIARGIPCRKSCIRSRVEPTETARGENAVSEQNVVLLTNFVPPYRVPLFRALEQRLRSLRVLISTPMDPSRPWTAEWQGLDVIVQRSFTLRRLWRHPHGFVHRITIYVPYDTVWQLMRAHPNVVISGEVGARTIQALLYRSLRPRTRLI